MLIFVDQDKHVRVVRMQSEDGVSTRTPLGRVQKNRLDVADDLRALLTSDEIDQVEAAVEIYKQAAAANAQYYSLNFPAIAREVMDRFESGASNAERQLVMGALMEAVRRMRKFERESQPAL
jgi:hypothetical protein